MNRAVAEALSMGMGVIARRDFPALGGPIDYARRAGELVRILPAVYAHRDIADDWFTRVLAVGLWNPHAVITGESAAALTFWPDRQPRTVDVAGARLRARIPGFTFSTRHIPAELVANRARIRVTHPNLTVLDLVDRYGGDPIDDALRHRMATVNGMYRALQLTAYRVGNRERRRMVLDSRTEPWSSGERQAHRELRSARVTNWKANVEIWCQGQQFFQDIAFDDCPLVVEIDGKTHLRPEVFESDTRRGNLLFLAGKDLLHFTSSMLAEGLLIPTIRQARARYGLR